MYTRPQRNVVHLFRWLFVVPAGYAGFALAILTTLFLDAALASFCPEEHMSSGSCYADWYLAASELLIVFGAGLAGVYVILLATHVAPTHKLGVARLTYAIGLVVAIRMSVDAGGAFWAHATCAGVFGALTLAALERWAWVRRSAENHGRARGA